jgi:hypothetical protein
LFPKPTDHHQLRERERERRVFLVTKDRGILRPLPIVHRTRVLETFPPFGICEIPKLERKENMKINVFRKIS